MLDLPDRDLLMLDTPMDDLPTLAPPTLDLPMPEGRNDIESNPRSLD